MHIIIMCMVSGVGITTPRVVYMMYHISSGVVYMYHIYLFLVEIEFDVADVNCTVTYLSNMAFSISLVLQLVSFNV